MSYDYSNVFWTTFYFVPPISAKAATMWPQRCGNDDAPSTSAKAATMWQRRCGNDDALSKSAKAATMWQLLPRILHAAHLSPF